MSVCSITIHSVSETLLPLYLLLTAPGYVQSPYFYVMFCGETLRVNEPAGFQKRDYISIKSNNRTKLIKSGESKHCFPLVAVTTTTDDVC